MAEAISAAIDAAAAGQQHSLTPVIVCIAELALVLANVDQIVGGKGQAVDGGVFKPLGILHHSAAVAIEHAWNRAGRSS